MPTMFRRLVKIVVALIVASLLTTTSGEGADWFAFCVLMVIALGFILWPNTAGWGSGSDGGGSGWLFDGGDSGDGGDGGD